MAHLSNLKTNERSNVEQPNLHDTKLGNENLKNRFISKDEYGKFEKSEDFSIW